MDGRAAAQMQLFSRRALRALNLEKSYLPAALPVVFGNIIVILEFRSIINRDVILSEAKNLMKSVPERKSRVSRGD